MSRMRTIIEGAVMVLLGWVPMFGGAFWLFDALGVLGIPLGLVWLIGYGGVFERVFNQVRRRVGDSSPEPPASPPAPTPDSEQTRDASGRAD